MLELGEKKLFTATIKYNNVTKHNIEIVLYFSLYNPGNRIPMGNNVKKVIVKGFDRA